MRKGIVWLTVLLLALNSFFPAFAAPYPSPTGKLVNDFADVLTAEEEQKLEENLLAYEKETSNQIAIVIIKSLQGEDINTYANELFAKWGIGQKDKNNGVLLLAAIDDRLLRIEVGYGLEAKLTDAISGDIRRNYINPRFREGNYYAGLVDGIEQIKKTIAEEYAANNQSPPHMIETIALSGYLLWALLSVGVYLASFLGRNKEIWPGAVVGVFLGLILGGMVAAVVGGLLGLFLDWLLSRNYQKLKALGKKTDWLHSGGGFWVGSRNNSRRGFGGFGGGLSGGGGSFGRW